MKSFILSALASAVLMACSSGGGDSGSQTGGTDDPGTVTTATISGTAAGGAPVVGFVTVKDATGKLKTTQIAADGSYSVDVSDMTAPFMLRASGTVGSSSVSYYSAASSDDQGKTINVTPFTTMMVSNIAAKLAETYYSEGTFGGITAQALGEAESNLQLKLTPVLQALGLSASIDLLRESFKADHSGLDAVLDLIKVEIDVATSVATLTNLLTNLKIGEDNLASGSDDATTVTVSAAELSALSTATTDLQKIQKALTDFATLFATGTPSEAALSASGLFDEAAFLEEGQNFAQFASSLASDAEELVGVQLTSSDIVITGPNTAKAIARLAFKDGSTDTFDTLLTRASASSDWKITGSGRVLEADVSPLAYAFTANDMSTPSYDAGLSLYADVEAYNANHPGQEILKAIVTGPGVKPAAGITMETTVESGYMTIVRSDLGGASGSYSGNFAPQCSATITVDCIDFSQAKDNSSYTIKLLDGQEVQVASYPLTLPYAPVSRTQVGASNFPQITGLTVNGAALTNPADIQNGRTVTAQWTKPSLIEKIDELRFNYLKANNAFVQLEEDLAKEQTSESFLIDQADESGALGARFELYGQDQFERDFLTIYEVRPVN